MQNDFFSFQIKQMQEILEESEGSLNSLKISKGIWYATEYYKACTHLAERSLLEAYITEGATFHGYGSTEFWSYRRDLASPSGYIPYLLILKKGKLPSEALVHLKRAFSLLDCGMVCYLATALALLRVLSQEKFDHLFDPEGPFPFVLAGNEKGSLAPLMPRLPIQNEREIQRGDIAYFGNCSAYVAKHPGGESRGFNLLCVENGGKEYLGFGLGGQGRSRLEVERSLWEAFNEDPLDEGFYPPHVWNHLYTRSLLCDFEKSKKLVASFQSKKMSWEEYEQDSGRLQLRRLPCAGKLGLWAHRPNLKRIQDLADVPLSQVREIMAQD